MAKTKVKRLYASRQKVKNSRTKLGGNRLWVRKIKGRM